MIRWGEGEAKQEQASVFQFNIMDEVQSLMLIFYSLFRNITHVNCTIFTPAEHLKNEFKLLKETKLKDCCLHYISIRMYAEVESSYALINEFVFAMYRLVIFIQQTEPEFVYVCGVRRNQHIRIGQISDDVFPHPHRTRHGSKHTGND